MTTTHWFELSLVSRLILLSPIILGTALAQQSPQTPLAGKNIPQWAQPLPTLGNGLPVITDADVTLTMCEFQTSILPLGTPVAGSNGQAPSTWAWGYVRGTTCPASQANYLGPVVVASKGTPTSMTFVNKLGTAATTNVLAYKNSVDQTLMWADPSNDGRNACATENEAPEVGSDCAQNYKGTVPTAAHLHGGEVPPELDGGPDSWVTANGTARGAAYYSAKQWGPVYLRDAAGAPIVDPVSNQRVLTGVTDTLPPNAVKYNYPNTQEASPIWFHDHIFGATRLNVYAGIAGAYYVADAAQEARNTAIKLPPTTSLVPLVIQDRMFDTNGQLFFPAASLGGVLWSVNPDHPYWVPEFIGDAIVVNGKAWPFLNVEPKRYRFLVLNGSNARSYDLSLPPGIPMYVIGNDGGLLDKAAAVPNLVVMPGERYEIIIDFTGLNPGKSVILQNSARAPYPGGAPPSGGLAQIVQFRVVPCGTPGLTIGNGQAGCGAADASFNPAGPPKTAPLLRATPINRIVTAGAPATTLAVKRMLTLNEILLPAPTKKTLDPATGAVASYPGGPVEILVNNTRYSGKSSREHGDFLEVRTGSSNDINVSELPEEGTTEEWDIVNLTADAHPIHLHLVQFQVLNRQAFDLNNYTAAYGAAFASAPGCKPAGPGLPCDGFGPPGNYRVGNTSGYLGGNPDVKPFLKGAVIPPAAQETGWKDTVMVPPGMVTRFVVRWAPTSVPVGASGTAAAFPFDVSGASGATPKPVAYVWHCHIIDHEDNEMMRPDFVTPVPGATRTYPRQTEASVTYTPAGCTLATAGSTVLPTNPCTGFTVTPGW